MLQMENFKPVKLNRSKAVPLGDALAKMVRANHLSMGLILNKVSMAWDAASGASMWTAKRFYKDGVLTVTLKSPVLRSQLNMQLEDIMQGMNEMLEEDGIVKMCGFDTHIKQIKLR